MKNKCENCYIEVKKYTILKGILLTIMVQIIICIPILNMYILKLIEDSFHDKGYEPKYRDFWDGVFYYYKKVKVKFKEE